MKTIKRLCVLTTIILLVFSCRTDDSVPEILPTASLVNHLKPSDIPGVMNQLNKKINYSAGSNYSSNSSSASSSVGTIKLDQILQVLDTLGNANYTFQVDDEDNNPFTFTNLVIKEWSDGFIPAPYLMHYKLDSSQITEYLEHDFSMHYFKGTIAQESIGSFTWNNELGANLEGEYEYDGLFPCPPNAFYLSGGGTSDGSFDDGGLQGIDFGGADLSCSFEVAYEACPVQQNLGHTYVSEPHDEAACGANQGTGATVLLTTCNGISQMSSNDEDPCYINIEGDIGVLDDVEFEDFLKALSLDESIRSLSPGIIPQYLWQSGLLNPYAAGIIDGIWDTIESTWTVVEFLGAWAPLNFSAEAMEIRRQTFQFLLFLNDLVRSEELREQAWNEIKTAVVDYLDVTLSLTNEGMYNQGRLIFDAASMFFGIGEAKAILKGQKFTVGLVKLLKQPAKHLSSTIFKAKKLGHNIVKSGDEISIKTTGRNGTEIAHIAGDNLTMRYSGYGGNIAVDPNKTTTVIGKFDDSVNGEGIRKIKDGGLYNYGESRGGINILDDPAWTWEKNLQWLNDAMSRNDIIRVSSDPLNNLNLFNGSVKSIFGKEVQHLLDNGYEFNPSTFVFNKN